MRWNVNVQEISTLRAHRMAPTRPIYPSRLDNMALHIERYTIFVELGICGIGSKCVGTHIIVPGQKRTTLAAIPAYITLAAKAIRHAVNTQSTKNLAGNRF